VDDHATELAAVARGGGIVCALTRRFDEDAALVSLDAWSSSDDGHTWSGPTVVSTTIDGAAALAFDGAGFVGAGNVADPSGNVRRVLGFTSADCVRWNDREAPLFGAGLAFTSASALDYTVGPFAADGSIVHELWFRAGNNVLRSTSPTGAPGSFAGTDGAELLMPSGDPDFSQSSPRSHRHLMRVGRDLVILFGAGRDVRMLVRQDDGGWSGRPIPLVAPSHADGTFDATSVRHGALVMLDPPSRAGLPWPARFVYTGDGADCARCSVTGTADLYFGTSSVPEPEMP
jgi:hypothetical protein